MTLASAQVIAEQLGGGFAATQTDAGLQASIPTNALKTATQGFDKTYTTKTGETANVISSVTANTIGGEAVDVSASLTPSSPTSAGGGGAVAGLEVQEVEEEEEEAVEEEEIVEEEEEVTRPIIEMTVLELKAEIVRIQTLIAELQTRLASFLGEAVIKFQLKYKAKILVPWGLIKGTGYVGKTSVEKLNELLGK